MGKSANFALRKKNWGTKRALHWEVMNILFKLGVRVHYINVEGNVREILGEDLPEVPPGYEARYVGLNEMLPHVDCVPDLDRAFLNEVFARGDVCIANFHGTELLGFAFVSFTRARVTGQLDALVPDGFQYVYKGWTHPAHRRKNLAAARVYLRHKLLLANRNQRSISYVETHNYQSLLHSYRHPRERSLRMGFCGWITVFGRQIPLNSRRARWVGFELIRRDDDGRRQYTR